MAPDYSKRASDKSIPWQTIAVGISIIAALSAVGKTWFLNDYRLEQLEKQVVALDAKVDKLDERMVKLDTTYHLLIEQAREHGWNVPWQRRGR